MILTYVCLTKKVMKTEWDVVFGDGPPPEGLEDVIPENRLVHNHSTMEEGGGDDASIHAWQHAEARAQASRIGATSVLCVDQE